MQRRPTISTVSSSVRIGKWWIVVRFSIDALVKAGIYDNYAEQTTGVSIHKIVLPSAASTNHAAFVGEIDLAVQLSGCQGVLVLRAGYEAIWLEGVALAPGQIQETFITTGICAQYGASAGRELRLRACFITGATVGLEYSF